MVSNCKSLTKKLQHKICQNFAVWSCVSKNELGQIVKKTISWQLFLNVGQKKNFFTNTWKSVQFFCLVKCLNEHKWWKLFPTNLDCKILNHIGMVRPFCGLPMINCYQDHGLLSSVSFMHLQCLKDFVMFWIPLQKFCSKKSCCWMLQM